MRKITKTERKHEAVIDYLNTLLEFKEAKLLGMPRLLLTLDMHFAVPDYRIKEWLLDWIGKNDSRVMVIYTTDSWGMGNKRTWERWHLKGKSGWVSHLRILPVKGKVIDRGLSDEELKVATSFAAYLLFTNGVCPICKDRVYAENSTGMAFTADPEEAIQHYKKHPEEWKRALANLASGGLV